MPRIIDTLMENNVKLDVDELGLETAFFCKGITFEGYRENLETIE